MASSGTSASSARLWTATYTLTFDAEKDAERHDNQPTGEARVNRAYFWPGGRRDVVVQYAYAGEDWEDWRS